MVLLLLHYSYITTIIFIIINILTFEFKTLFVVLLYSPPILYCLINDLIFLLYALLVFRESILAIISLVAVSTNAALIVFTMDTFAYWKVTDKMWIFIGFQAFCFILQVIMTLAVVIIL